jgi:glutamyl-tRNA reductase
VPVISIGVDHDHAPLELLEAVTVPEADWHKVLASLRALEDLDELVLVSTCLRTEVYAVIERFHGAVDGVTAVLAERAGLGIDELTGCISVHFDRGVPQHLFAVAAGLRSAVPGETEVLGQLRRSLDRAEAEGTVGPELRELFRHALSAGRRARAETAISRGTTSFAHATVQLAVDRLVTLEGRRVVVVGAGQLASGLLDAMLDGRHAIPSQIVVANRTLSTAETLVGRDPARVTAVDLEALSGAMEAADLVITAVESDRHLVSSAMLERTARPLLVIDLGMPRTVAPDVGALTGVDLLDLAHLRTVVDTALRDRRDELVAAEVIVDEEVERHLEARRARGAAPLVTQLRAHLEVLRVAELERASSELSSLTDAQRAGVEQLTRGLVAKIAHDPTVALRRHAATDRGQRLADAVRTLFGL